MPKPLFIGIALISLILIGTFYFGIQSVILEDDFFTDEDFKIISPALAKDLTTKSGDTYEDENWKVVRQPDSGSGASAGQSVSNFVINNNQLVLSAKNAEATATFKKNMAHRDILLLTEGFQSETTIHLGDKNIATLSSTSQDPEFFTINLLLDTINTNEYHVFINGRETNKVIIDSENIVLKFVHIKGSFNIIKIASRPFFNCEVDTDETSFTAKYAEGEIVTFKSLPIQPVKFCPDSRTVILRDIETGDERTDYFRTSFKLLASGEPFIVPEGKLAEINYIIDLAEGQPSSNCGQGKYVSNGQCKQYVFEEEDKLELIRDTRTVLVTKGTITFNNALNIGDITISSDKPEFSCEEQLSETKDSENAPSPEPSCWTTKINGETHIYGQPKKFNDFITLTYIGDAQWKRSDGIADYTNTISLDLDRSFLRPKATNDDYYVELNKEHDITFEIDNKFTNFNDGGLSVIKQTDLLSGESSEIKTFELTTSKKVYSFKEKEAQLGKVTYTIIPFVKIGEQNVYADRALVYTYFVYQGEKPTTPTVEVEAEQSEQQKPVQSLPQEVTLSEEQSSYLVMIGIGIALIIIFFVIYIIVKLLL